MVNDDGDYELITNDTMSITDDDYEPSNTFSFKIYI